MVAEFYLENSQEFIFDYDIETSKEQFLIGQKVFNYKENPKKFYNILDIIHSLYTDTLYVLVEETKESTLNLLNKRISREQEVELEKSCVSNHLIIDHKKCIKWALDSLKKEYKIPFSNLRSNEEKYFEIIKEKVLNGVKLKEDACRKEEENDLKNGGLPAPSLDYRIAKPSKYKTFNKST